MIRTLVLSMRAVAVMALLIVVGAAAGGLGWPPGLTSTGPFSSASTPALADWAVAALHSSLRLGVELVGEHPQAAPVIGAVLGLWLMVPAVRHRLAVAYPRDPRRAYNNEERQAGFRRAGHRCEFDIWMGLARCKKPAEHCDHWLPHSRGGATTMPNLVAGCAWHNTSKGATMPTAAQTHRIARRRRGYFPAGEPTAPGERYRIRRRVSIS